jgi:hypothetical protein
MTDFKNTLPWETDDHPDSGMPRQLRTQADNEQPLTRQEAEVAGFTDTPETVYGDDSAFPNADDTRDEHRGDEP